MTESTTISPAVIADKNDWDNLVHQYHGSIYQLFAWSEICQKSYGYRPMYLLIKRAGRIIGLLPAVIRGKTQTLVSLPFVDSAGWLGSVKDILPLVSRYLYGRRFPFEIYSPQKTSLSLTAVYDTYFLPLAPDYESVFSRFHHKTRNMVRKAWSGELTSEVLKPDSKLINDFVGLYQQTMKRLGVVTLSTSLFRAVAEKLQNYSFLSTVRYRHQPVAFLWLFLFDKQIYIWANATDRNFLTLGANYRVYDQAIRFGFDRHCAKIILGASEPQSPQGFFKNRWGAEHEPVYLVSSEVNPRVRWQAEKLLRPLLKNAPMSVYKIFSDFALRNLA